MKSSTIYAPDTQKLEKLFLGDLTCKMVYGTVVCGAPAQWKVIMACCDGSDFFCAECFVECSRPPLPRGTVLKAPGFLLTDAEPGYFGCSLCHTVHKSWKDAVKESVKI